MSKIVSVNPRFQSVLFKKTTAFASRVSGDTHLHSTTGAAGPPPGPEIPQDAVFFFPLKQGVGLKELVNDVTGTLTRANDSTYERGGTWFIAGPNVPRWGNIGLVRSGEFTNINTNFNAAPNTSLVNVSPNGATLSAVSNPTAIAAAGLSNLVPDGFVFELDNQTAGPVTSTIAGATVAGNVHTASAWVNTFGSTVGFGFSGDGGQANISSNALERAVYTANVPTGGQTLAFTLDAGERIQFILNQVNLQELLQNPAITLGAASSEGAESLSFDVTPYSPAMVDGAASAYVVNKFPVPGASTVLSRSRYLVNVLATTAGIGIFGLSTSAGNNSRFAPYVNVSTQTGMTTADWVVADFPYHVIGRWGAAAGRQVAMTTNAGLTTWIDGPIGGTATLTSESGTIYIGHSHTDPVYPHELYDIALFGESKTLEFLKDNT